MEKDFISDSLWEVPADLSQIREAGKEGGLTEADAERLLEAIQTTAAQKGSYMVTVTDGAMLDVAHNMIRSLDAVPCQAPRLVIGLGSNLCSAFQGLSSLTCVEVFQDATSSEESTPWGTHEYWQVVFRKHAVLTMVAMSKMARHVIYTDPDIVYMDCPISYLVKNYRTSHDIVFSSNNMLDPDATSVEDVAKTYETRGMADIVLGPNNRHADINTGLFLMHSSDKVSDLMLKTMRIFKEQEYVHGHYQQFSLVKALAEVPGLRVGVAAGDRLVNGNVFWGHRQLLESSEVISVHANWMQAKLKVPCLKAAGLWVDADAPRRLSRADWDQTTAARMDADYATVQACGGVEADVQAQMPPQPARPGCYLWLPSGCREHMFNAQDSWRWMEDLKDRNQCELESKAMYNRWCGTTDAETLFVASLPNAPVEPGETGCYVWMPSGCEKQNFHARTSWRKASASDFPTRDSCTESVPSKFNKWCDTTDAQVLWVPAAPEIPSGPGCYAWLPTGCKDHPSSSSGDWIRDTWGEQNEGARANQQSCGQRKQTIESWCGISNAKMAFVEGS